MGRLDVEIAKAQAGMDSADQRAANAERLLEQVRAELQTERERHDVSLSQLHEPARPAHRSDSSPASCNQSCSLEAVSPKSAAKS